jgi:hypothetical protein
MIRVSWRSLLIALLVNVAVCSVLGGAVAASRHTRSVEALDQLIPREKWAGAGLDKLTAGEQQALAEDITSLVAGSRMAESGGAVARDRSQWRKLQRHMTKDDVRRLLGEPGLVSVSRFSESWYYAGGSVTFNGKGRVDMWSED